MWSEMSELRIDVSELKREGEDLVKELAVFLEEKTKAKVEATENEIIVKGEALPKKLVLRTLLKDFLQKVNVKAKVKTSKENTLTVIKSKGKPIFCHGNAWWRNELENRLQTDDEVVLLALGNVKYEVLSHLNKRKDIKIVKLETRHMKKREKGTGLKATVRKRRQPTKMSKY